MVLDVPAWAWFRAGEGAAASWSAPVLWRFGRVPGHLPVVLAIPRSKRRSTAAVQDAPAPDGCQGVATFLSPRADGGWGDRKVATPKPDGAWEASQSRPTARRVARASSPAGSGGVPPPVGTPDETSGEPATRTGGPKGRPSSAQGNALGIRRPTKPWPEGARYAALAGRRNSWGAWFPRRCLGLREVAPWALGAGISGVSSAGVFAGGFGRRLAARRNTGPGGPVNPPPGRLRYGKRWSKRDSCPLFGSSKAARSAGEGISDGPGGRRLRSLGACICLPQPSPGRRFSGRGAGSWPILTKNAKGAVDGGVMCLWRH